MVIIDTSILIEISRKNKTALDLIESYKGKGQIATTVVTKYEMLRGANEKDQPFITELLDKFLIYEFNENAVSEAVHTYKKLRTQGEMINELDIIIAAIAMANNETLLTKDKDFKKLKNDKIKIQ